MSLKNNILNDDEIFLKEFLKKFYRQVLKIENFTKYENILKEWVKDFLKYNEKSPEIILKLMKEHEEKENWFSSIIGFFYEHDIAIVIDDNNNNNDNTNKNNNSTLEFYLLSIYNYNENNNLTSIYQLFNIIISKYLLSFYYYKEIILNKRDLITKEIGYSENLYVMSHNQVENFNGLEINLCKDEIKIMEKYFESQEKIWNRKKER
ncbi:unnamed protein product [Rhizophagus irregularis]|nr:unnamed protein product [Rhizophagus irregularis]